MAENMLMWFRGISFVKDFLVRYLRYIFAANQKGIIKFVAGELYGTESEFYATDGTQKMIFSNTPFIMKRASWDARTQMPAILIGTSSGALPIISVPKDLLTTETEVISEGADTVKFWKSYGGDFDMTYTLSIRATTIEERDKLVDITGIYLSHPDAKDYFMQHYLVLPEGVRVGGEKEVKEPGIDHPVYVTDLSVKVLSRWQESRAQVGYRLGNVIADVEAYVSEIDAGRVILDGEE